MRVQTQNASFVRCQCRTSSTPFIRLRLDGQYLRIDLSLDTNCDGIEDTPGQAFHLVCFQCSFKHNSRLRRKPFLDADRSRSEKRKPYQRQPITSVENVAYCFIFLALVCSPAVFGLAVWYRPRMVVMESFSVAFFARSLDVRMVRFYLLT
jgi:hypothetical protein